MIMRRPSSRTPTRRDQQAEGTPNAQVTAAEVKEQAETLRDILPITYSALLDTDQAVRSGGIDLWAACAAVADSLPAELAELSIPLLQDVAAQLIAQAFNHRRVPRKTQWVAVTAARAHFFMPFVVRSANLRVHE